MIDLVHVHHEKEISTIILNRPEKRNALNRAMMAEILEALDECTGRVVIFEGNGENFCSGIDLHQAREEGVMDLVAEVFNKIYTSSLITIASVHGSVMAGGIGIVAACDIAIAEENTRFTFPEVLRGLIPTLVFHLLQGRISDRILQEMFLSGREFTSEEALRLGLIHHRVSHRLRKDFAQSTANKILLGAPQTQMKIKEMFCSFHPFLMKEALDVHVSTRSGAEAKEGVAAFEEKRPPRWKTSE